MLHVRIHPKTFGPRLKALATIAPKQHPVTVLKTIQFRATADGHGVLTATNFDTTVSLTVPNLRVISPGTVQLPPATLLKLIAQSKESALRLEELAPESAASVPTPTTPTRMIALQGTRTQATLASAGPEDFPVLEDFPVPAESSIANPIRLPVWALQRLIEASGYAADPHAARYTLGGCAIEYADGTLSMLATDGRRLAHAQASASGGVLTPAPFRDGDPEHPLAPVVGLKALKSLKALLGEAQNPNELLELAWTEDGFLAVRTSELSLRTRQLEGRFPSWQEIVPPPSPYVTEVTDMERFRRALMDAKHLLPDGHRSVRFRLRRNILTVEVDYAEASSTCELVTLRRTMAPELGEIVAELDPEHLLDWAQVVTAFALEFPEDSGHPAVFRSRGLTYYLMPMKQDGAKVVIPPSSPEASPEEGPPPPIAADAPAGSPTEGSPDPGPAVIPTTPVVAEVEIKTGGKKPRRVNHVRVEQPAAGPGDASPPEESPRTRRQTGKRTARVRAGAERAKSPRAARARGPARPDPGGDLGQPDG